MQETMNGKAIKFRALAEKRVTTVIRTVRRIGNLSRRSTYDYTDDQVAKLIKAMRDEIDAVELKFAPREDRAQQVLFRFD
jgi:hypothetical protein